MTQNLSIAVFTDSFLPGGGYWDCHLPTLQSIKRKRAQHFVVCPRLPQTTHHKRVWGCAHQKHASHQKCYGCPSMTIFKKNKN